MKPVIVTSLAARIASTYARDASILSRKLARPDILGPQITIKMRKILKNLYILSLLTSILSPLIALASPTLGLLLALIAMVELALPNIAVATWRRMLGWGLDRETPAVLTYLLPYASGPKYLADVIVGAPREHFTWLRWEADRLEYLLSLGHDPLSALRELARTTPSKKLREALLDYVNTHELGAPRSQVTMRLLERALAEARGQWRGYIELAKGIIESVVALTMSLVVLAPIGFMASKDIAPLTLIPAILSPVGALALISMRPAIGEGDTGGEIPLLAVTGAFASTIAFLVVGWKIATIILAVLTIIVEYRSHLAFRVEEKATMILREIAVGAKYGRFTHERIAEALPAASKVLRALISALTYAGKLGISEALINVYRVLEEAREARLSSKGQGLILTGVAVLTPPISIYMINMLANLAKGGEALGITSNPQSLAVYLAAASPLIPVIGAALWRGRKLSLTPSLIALVLSLGAYFMLG
ncbi:MAG: hypothetical protein F7C33_00700 [Desulfurococcales archaeon]|nr:hypothetical protein [Desulfurococcales archaeon]